MPTDDEPTPLDDHRMTLAEAIGILNGLPQPIVDGFGRVVNVPSDEFTARRVARWLAERVHPPPDGPRRRWRPPTAPSDDTDEQPTEEDPTP